jgi:hypothetical protein
MSDHIHHWTTVGVERIIEYASSMPDERPGHGEVYFLPSYAKPHLIRACQNCQVVWLQPFDPIAAVSTTEPA